MSIIVQTSEQAPQNPNPSGSEGAAKDQAHSKDDPSAPEESSEQNESLESETKENEGNKESDKESDGEDSEEEDEPKDAAKDQPRKKGGFQRRIDKLNAAKSQAQQEAEYWKRLALETKAAGEPKPASKAETAKTEAAGGEPKADDYDTHAEFVRALTRWEVQQARSADKAEADKSRLQSEHQTKVQSYVERREAFQAKTPDFDEVMEDVEGIRLSPAVESLLLESENGPELAYELAKNKDELTRICKLGPLAAAREIGKFESKLSSPPSEAKKDLSKKVTQAQAPLAPVRGGKASLEKSLDNPNLSQKEYEAIRAKQRAKRSG